MVLGQASRYSSLYKTRHVHASELEARLAKTHLQLLRMQLQPHFLFNTLNTVAELVHTDPDTADQMITRLGRLLRLSLDHAGHQVVPLRQEIDFLRMYVEIEQVRFQDRLQIVWDLAPDTLDAAVPTLLWHPVLENAIRHGVTPLGGPGPHRYRLSPRGRRPGPGDPGQRQGAPARRESPGGRGPPQHPRAGRVSSTARGLASPWSPRWAEAPSRRSGCPTRPATEPTRRCRCAQRPGGAGRMTLRVVVADDEPIGRQRLVRLLQAEPETEVVAACADGEEAVEAIREHVPDLVLLDIQMPRLDGFEVVAALGEAHQPGSHLRDGARPVCGAGLRGPCLRLPAEAGGPGSAARGHGVGAVRHPARARRASATRRVLALLEELNARERARGRDRLVVRTPERAFFLRTETIDWIEAAGKVRPPPRRPSHPRAAREHGRAGAGAGSQPASCASAGR